MTANSENCLLSTAMLSSYQPGGSSGDSGGTKGSGNKPTDSRVDHSTGVVSSREDTGVFSNSYTDEQRGKAYDRYSKMKPYQLMRLPNTLTAAQKKKY